MLNQVIQAEAFLKLDAFLQAKEKEALRLPHSTTINVLQNLLQQL